jgi:hypothetical protein
VTTHTEPVTPDMMVAAGSHVIFYFIKRGGYRRNLAPAGGELRGEDQQTVEGLGEAFAKMKRGGD